VPTGYIGEMPKFGEAIPLGFMGFLTGLFRRTGMWDFLKELTKRRHQLKAEEARINAINQLLPKLPDGAVVVQVGADGYFVICSPGAPPINGLFGAEMSPPVVERFAPPEIEAQPESLDEIDDECDLYADYDV
jgi:hypothetical protein